MAGGYISFMDMLDGGGAGRSGPSFEGGGVLSAAANALARPAGSRERGDPDMRTGLGGFARDMVDGGGFGRSGPTFRGGPLSGLLNAARVRPLGYKDRLGSVRPQMRQQVRPQMSSPAAAAYTPPAAPAYTMHSAMGTPFQPQPVITPPVVMTPLPPAPVGPLPVDVSPEPLPDFGLPITPPDALTFDAFIAGFGPGDLDGVSTEVIQEAYDIYLSDFMRGQAPGVAPVNGPR